MSELWLVRFCLPCCATTEQPQPRRRPRIDRSMIGQPMNFQHTGHIGSGDMATSSVELGSIQCQMKSKGGYTEAAVANHATPAGIAVGGN